MPTQDQPFRHSRRWQGFDYRSGRTYFVTICTHGREPLLSSIDERCRSRLTIAGGHVADSWDALPGRFPGVSLDTFVVMPDHVHGLIAIDPAGTPPSLGTVVGAFKSLAARAVNEALGRQGRPLWQRGYYDRVMRSDEELERARWYIDENPARWAAARYVE